MPGESVTIVQANWIGDSILDVVYRTDGGTTGTEMVYREKESELEVVSGARRWTYDADGALLRLVSEAQRIRLAHLFDPYLAVHTSLIEPLPHQITAVYGEMLPRQPLRFLLADDPGAGKTIMAGLLIRELIVRGDVERCLVVCPGSLADQWQEELYEKFNLPFELLTRDLVEASPSGNVFNEVPHMVARLDHLSRNDDLLDRLSSSNWDLIICDEAHRMSASYFGTEVKYTKRHRLGQLLSEITRHFLLMTATPHNGKEADFQLFMSLLDPDRFEGKPRGNNDTVDVSDLMRRMIKEKLVRFDGKPLFPERRAYTSKYALSPAENRLYMQVTNYVRDQFNAAENLAKGRRGTVGFALTILQRRLASSPEAILQSLHRRRQKLEDKLQLAQHHRRHAFADLPWDDLPTLSDDELEEFDDIPDCELEELEELFMDKATAAQSLSELRGEIETLSALEKEAQTLLTSGLDRKWEQLSNLLQENPALYHTSGVRRKLVIFTEHRDTMNYLVRRIGTLTGEPDSIVTIHGALGRDQRRLSASRFTSDPTVSILVATDAAGEGINLQCAHLMVNYDLPWNPNRLEQRFGRIHRIGQTEVCHLWNLVASGTRESLVLERLCEKIETESVALSGQIFDVLGKAFGDTNLRDLILQAIRYGERPDVRAKLSQQVDSALDQKHIKDLVEEQALVHDVMDDSKVREVRLEMERHAARRLQPHFIRGFFMEAFRHLGGNMRERETGRFEIRHVPAVIRQRDRQAGHREQVLDRYERVTFEKERIKVKGQIDAVFICPGHPLLNAVIDLLRERYHHLMRQGAVLIAPDDPEEVPRALFYIEHAIRDGRVDKTGTFRTISRRLQFTELEKGGTARNAGYAPYLDYRPATAEEIGLAHEIIGDFADAGLEKQAIAYAATHLARHHLQEVKERQETRIRKTMQAVQERLTQEIYHWDQQAAKLRADERAGKTNAKLNADKAQQRADDLAARRERRLEELNRERQIAALAPVITGGALVLPQGLINRLKGHRQPDAEAYSAERRRVELAGMEAVMALERRLGHSPRDVSADNLGYDIESVDGESGRLRMIEVKGRIQDADTVCVTRNEIYVARNKPDQWILAIVLVPPAAEPASREDIYRAREKRAVYHHVGGCEVWYIQEPFDQDPDFAETSKNLQIKLLQQRGERRA